MLLNDFYAGLEKIGFVDSGSRRTVAGHECRSYDVPEHLRSVLVSVNVGVAGDKPSVSFQDAKYREIGVGYDGRSNTPHFILMCSPDQEILEILSGDAESVGLWLDSRPLFIVETVSGNETRKGVVTRLGIFDLNEKPDG